MALVGRSHGFNNDTRIVDCRDGHEARRGEARRVEREASETGA